MNPDTASNTVAQVDFYLPKMRVTFNNWRVIKGKWGLLVTPPAMKLSENNYLSLIEFDGDLQGILTKAVLEAARPQLSPAP